MTAEEWFDILSHSDEIIGRAPRHIVHVASGEDIATALYRETQEELGIKIDQYLPLFDYIMQNSYESEWCNAFAAQYDGPIFLNSNEISKGSGNLKK